MPSTPLPFPSKLPAASTTVFTTMSSLAAAHHAINLGQGFPDFDVDPTLAALVAQAMREGHNQYAHMFGVPALRAAIAQKVGKLYGHARDAETEITITPGGTYALFTAFACLLQPGDEVIILEPAYDSYIPQIQLFGARAVPVAIDLQQPGIDWDAVRKAVTQRTKALVINSPHNPSGLVLSQADMQALEQIVVEKNLFLVSDEVYEHLVFDGLAHHSVLKFPALFARSFVCFSFGKTYSCTGWKLGYCVAPPPLTAAFRAVHQFNAFSCHTPMQHAFAGYLLNRDAYLQLAPAMEAKRNYLRSRLEPLGFVPLHSHGSYFELYDYSGLSSIADADMANLLVTKAGVAAIPLSAFYHAPQGQQILRFCFAKKEATLQEAAARLSNYFG